MFIVQFRKSERDKWETDFHATFSSRAIAIQWAADMPNIFLTRVVESEGNNG